MDAVATWETLMSFAKVSMANTGSDPEVAKIDLRDIADALDGGQDAYGRLVKRHQDAVSKWMWRFTRDRVILEELVQDVFIEVWMSLSRFKGESAFKTWLFTIATRVGYRYWRKKAKDVAITTEVADRLMIDDKEKEITPSEAAEVLYGLFSGLPPRDRLVLTLIYFEDMDTKEIARMTGWTRSMVKVQAYRARNKLRKLLERAGYGKGKND
ncbi:MAG: sigma-70 family RNA polymerase sigma factor [Candidatus Tectomicrobia bacterium]|uniref:Sigma-70 family RNA polymerase sigma factor n=1 Tax=Tectimicrobiota bacterium TaxID=2528274 RepID=A0A933LQS4_UNCTE|nr:sigma-70 family RNA polymerase sigma factor [Candidatus Tectomicrobia bacterium]